MELPPPPPPDSPEFTGKFIENFGMHPLQGAPFYWRAETSGHLAAAVQKYFDAPQTLKPHEVGYIRAYIAQWIEAPAWMAIARAADEDSVRELLALREAARRIQSAADIRNWIRIALDSGQDPF